MSNHPHQRPGPSNGKGIQVTVPPSPTPVQMIVQQGQTADGPCVVLQMLTPVGQAVYFLPIEAARNLAQMLNDRATPVALA